MDQSRLFVLEIGTEELPPNDVVEASKQVCLYRILKCYSFSSFRQYILICPFWLYNDYNLYQLKASILEMLKKRILNHGEVHAFGTPRRLVV